MSTPARHRRAPFLARTRIAPSAAFQAVTSVTAGAAFLAGQEWLSARLGLGPPDLFGSLVAAVVFAVAAWYAASIAVDLCRLARMLLRWLG